MTIAKDIASKVLVAFVALAMIFTMFAPSAKAQSAEDLQKMINDLLAQIATLQSQVGQGGTPATASGFVFTRDLSQGATGADVMELQKFLNSDPDTRVSASGVGSMGMETEYYGPATAAAVSKFQVKYRAEILSPAGLVNPTGYFGPSTRAKANAMNTPVVVPPTPTPDEDGNEDEDDETPSTPALQGGEGLIEFDTLLDSDVAIDLGDSETVLEFEVEAKDADVAINRVDFLFDVRPWLYFSEVNLLVDGEEVASLSRSSDFSESGDNYRARFSGLDLIVREDDTAEIALEVVVLPAMAGSRDDDDVNVWVPEDGVRYVDGAGITSYGPDTMIGEAEISFDDTFGDGDIKTTLGANSPEALTVVLKESSRTTGNKVLEFDVEAEDGDVEVMDVSVEYTVSTNTVASTIYRARLLADGKVVSTKSVTGTGATASTTFTDIKVVIDDEDTVEFSVELDFNRGDTLVNPFVLTVDEVYVRAENADFAEKTDTLTVDEDHNLIVDGIFLTEKSTSVNAVINTTTADDSYGEFRITYDVTAVGDTMYVPLTAVRNASTTVGAAYRMEDSNGALVATGTVTQSLTRKSGGSVSGNYVRINDGQTATFELYVTYNPAASGQFRLQLLTVGFNPTAAATPTETVDALPTEDYETGNLQITS